MVRRLRYSDSLRAAELRLWAFVSVINNVTQHVTTIEPQ
jgi:hypothetical protein